MYDECYIKESSFIIESHSSMQKVPLADILYITIKNDYTFFVLSTRKELMTTVSLFHLESILPDFFYRINKSAIINMHYCQSGQFSYKRSSIEMSDGTEWVVSRRRYLNFKEKCKDY